MTKDGKKMQMERKELKKGHQILFGAHGNNCLDFDFFFARSPAAQFLAVHSTKLLIKVRDVRSSQAAKRPTGSILIVIVPSFIGLQLNVTISIHFDSRFYKYDTHTKQ